MAKEARLLHIDNEKLAKIRHKIGLGDINDRMAEVFKVMADPTRLRIIQALELTDLCVNDIASLIGISQPSVSHHLRTLRHGGLVKSRKSGKTILYSLKESRISAILAVVRDYARG